jgi:hypothetical protein
VITQYGKDYYSNQLVVNKTTWYLALLTALPNDAISGGTLNTTFEVQDVSYVRKPMLSADFGLSSEGRGVVSYSNSITYDAAVLSWGTVVGYAIVDEATNGDRSLTAGNVYAIGTFPQTYKITPEQIMYIPAGVITLSITSTDIKSD